MKIVKTIIHSIMRVPNSSKKHQSETVHILGFILVSHGSFFVMTPKQVMLVSRVVCLTTTLQELGDLSFWCDFRVSRHERLLPGPSWLQFGAWTRVRFLRSRLVGFFGWLFRCYLGCCFFTCFCVVTRVGSLGW